MGMLFPFLSLFALGSFSSAGVLYVNAPLPFKDSGVRQQRFNDGAALCLGIFSNEQFPQPGAVEFAARVRSVAQR